MNISLVPTAGQRPLETAERLGRPGATPADPTTHTVSTVPVDSASIGATGTPSATASTAAEVKNATTSTAAVAVQNATTAADVIHTSVLIIGSGPAGYSAAIYAARAGLEPVMVTGMVQGGQLMLTTDVENYPGYVKPINGPQLMEDMRAQAEHMGTRIESDLITNVDLSQRPFVATGDSGQKYSGDTLIVATGANAKWLGIPSEEEYRGAGVSACATCDGFFFRDKSVAVVGGGSTAVGDALVLSGIAHDVTLIHRGDKLTAEKVLQDRLFANPKVKVIWNTAVEEVKGEGQPKRMTGLRLRDKLTKEARDLPADGMFVAIGFKPASDLFKGKLDLNPQGYIVTTPGSTATSVPGVFAAGDVQDDKFRQAVVAAGSGCISALEAQDFLMKHESENIAK